MAYSSKLSNDDLMIINPVDEHTILFEKDGLVHWLLDTKRETLSIVSDQNLSLVDARGKNITQDVFDTTLCKALSEFNWEHASITFDPEGSHEDADPKVIEAIRKSISYATYYHNMSGHCSIGSAAQPRISEPLVPLQQQEHSAEFKQFMRLNMGN